MHKPLKLIPIGNSTGVILPKEMLARLKLEKGDAVSVTETADGYAIRPYEPDFEAKLEAARAVMRRRRSALRRSEEHTSELQSLMRISYAVFCLKKKTQKQSNTNTYNYTHQK